jgi:hypothetical protein
MQMDKAVQLLAGGGLHVIIGFWQQFCQPLEVPLCQNTVIGAHEKISLHTRPIR